MWHESKSEPWWRNLALHTLSICLHTWHLMIQYAFDSQVVFHLTGIIIGLSRAPVSFSSEDRSIQRWLQKQGAGFYWIKPQFCVYADGMQVSSGACCVLPVGWHCFLGELCFLSLLVSQPERSAIRSGNKPVCVPATWRLSRHSCCCRGEVDGPPTWFTPLNADVATR